MESRIENKRKYFFYKNNELKPNIRKYNKQGEIQKKLKRPISFVFLNEYVLHCEIQRKCN